LIKEYLLKRYPGDFHRTIAVRDGLEQICLRHIERGLGDPNFVNELCADSDTRYWQRLSEALLANELIEAGLALQPSRPGRPDFLIEHQGQNIWIEAMCPEPKGLPKEWLVRTIGKAIDFPHEAMLLRWTAAIKEKAEKLLGNESTGASGYIQ
jgi:type I restriction enzyme S subunit